MSKTVDKIVKAALDTDKSEINVIVDGFETEVNIFRREKGMLLIVELTGPVDNEWVCAAKLEVNRINREGLGNIRVCIGEILDQLRVEIYCDKKKESVTEGAESLIAFIQAKRAGLIEMFHTSDP